jgi:ADP-heptose:LPS heptosyltransferase
MTPPTSGKALLVRMDRIGDLILTLPVDGLFKDWNVCWAISPGLEFIARHAEPPRTFVTVGPRFSLAEFRKLFRFLRAERFDLAVVFHAPWWVSLALWLARVKIRVGVKSQWHSFLFFNKGVRQKRSQASYHESEYNRRLVASGLGLERAEDPSPLVLRPPLESFSARPRFEDYVVVHPGMGGSARNWPMEFYSELIKKLLTAGPVVVTGSASDRPWVEPILAAVGEHPRLERLELSDPKDWLFVLARASAVLAPSTGTLHVSAALGTPTLGIYSPVAVQAPKRWAPRGPSVAVLYPAGDCPGHRSCLMKACPRFDCMRDLGVEEVWDALNRIRRKGF